MKIAPLILLLLVGCGNSPQETPAPVAAPTVQAAAAARFGHISPIQLPAGEYFGGFIITAGAQGGAYVSGTPERYFFATTTGLGNRARGTHTLRDSQGVPVLIVQD